MAAPIGLPEALGTLLPRVDSPAGARPAATELPAGVGQAGETTGAAGPAPTPFINHLEHVIREADGAQRTAHDKAVDFAEHRSNDLHGTMISLAQADIQLRFVASIRNKVIEAYREVMRMGA